MATTTTNFGWDTPQSTDLVKDGATAIAALGQDIDTALVDLKGGTTNQVLAKNSNTDLDFKWVADASGISATIFDAKGDIIAATAADTADRLAVGANNTVLTADSSTATGLKWATPATGALTLITTATAANTTTTLSVNNCFTSTYDNYLIEMNMIGASEANLTLRLRLSGTETSANYAWSGILIDSDSSTVSGVIGNATTSFGLRDVNTEYGSYKIDVFYPQVAQPTNVHITAVEKAGASVKSSYFSAGGIQNATTQFDGFTVISSSGNLTGSVKVYGYSKS